MSGMRQTCLVTGASRGIGLGLTAVLAEDADVLAVCRKPTEALRALGVRIVEGVELSSGDAVGRIAAAVGETPLDLVIANAAVNESFDCDVDDLDPVTLAHEYEVNALGTVRTVLATLPRLHRGSTIALITTGVGATGRNTVDPGSYGYRMSKAALNTFGFLLARDLEPRGIAVVVLSPGMVATDMVRTIGAAGRSKHDRSLALDPIEAARRLVARMGEVTLETTGAWLDLDRRPMP
jgi:NAD(P)-dependent dehydrogenase (short-subunit alcohol dehydrogenase family)